MIFPRFIRWLSELPPPFALGLLWWGEITVCLCSLSGGYFLSVFLIENLKPSYQLLLFPLALIIYLLVFYILHLIFTYISLLMEGLVHIHRLGGKRRAKELSKEARRLKTLTEDKVSYDPWGEPVEDEPLIDPFAEPPKIRASAEQFKIRYFIILPATLVLYLLSFAVTIYRIFTRQIQTWEPGHLVLPALTTAAVGCLCYWLLMPALPGYVSVRKLIGNKTLEGD